MNKIIKDFGDEWEKFNQSNVNIKQNKSILRLFKYFHLMKSMKVLLLLIWKWLR